MRTLLLILACKRLKYADTGRKGWHWNISYLKNCIISFAKSNWSNGSGARQLIKQSQETPPPLFLDSFQSHNLCKMIGTIELWQVLQMMACANHEADIVLFWLPSHVTLPTFLSVLMKSTIKHETIHLKHFRNARSYLKG